MNNSVLERIKNKQSYAYVYDNVQGMPCNMKATTDLLHLAAIGERARWIPASERLPEHHQVVDVIYDHRRETDILFTDLGWKQYFSNPEMGRFIDGVTHWMPLPKSPGME